MRRPVCRLKKALYGHPDAGTYWEEKVDAHCKRVGFEPIGPEWPSCYFHQRLKLFLVIYVDDFKLAGPTANLKEGWALLRKHKGSGLDIEPERRVNANGATYLGCRMVKTVRTMPSGKKITVMEYDMQEFLQDCVSVYKRLPGLPSCAKHPRPSSRCPWGGVSWWQTCGHQQGTTG